MMEGGDLLTITVLVLAHLIIGQSHYYPNGVSWDSAATECGQHGLENDQHILRSISDLEGKTFWIGEKVYHLTLPWIEILGCFVVHNITSTHHNISPGQCQRQCMISTYFGYKEETRECVCLRQRGHNSSFDRCINRNISSSFLVYTNFSDSSFVSDPADGKNCITSSCTRVDQVQFVKVYCDTTSSSIKGVCDDGSDATTETSQIIWSQTQFEITHRCRTKHKLLPSSTYCIDLGVHVWTNMFRVEEDFEIKTDDAGDYKPIGCVAATLNNSVLYKTHISCDETVKYSVCKQLDSTTPDVTESSTYKPHVTESTNFKASVTVTTGFIFDITSTSSRPTVEEKNTSERPINLEPTTKKYEAHQTSTGNIVTTSKQYPESGTIGSGQKIENNTIPVGAIAGGIVGILVISLTVISLIVCRRRRVCMFQQKNNHSNMSNTYVDFSNTTSSNVKRSTDTDVNGSNTVNNAIYSGNFDADLVYSEEEAHQNSNKTDTDSSLECYDHLHVYDKRETMLSENLHSSNVGSRSNTDPTYDVSTMGTTQRKDANSIYDHTMKSMHNSNVGSRSNTDPTYDYSTMGTTQRKDVSSIYDHAMESMDSTCSNIDYVYAVSSKVKS